MNYWASTVWRSNHHEQCEYSSLLKLLHNNSAIFKKTEEITNSLLLSFYWNEINDTFRYSQPIKMQGFQSHLCNEYIDISTNNCGTCFKNALLPWRFWQAGKRRTGEVLIESARFPLGFGYQLHLGPLWSILGTFRQIFRRVKNNFKQNKIHLCKVQVFSDRDIE